MGTESRACCLCLREATALAPAAAAFAGVFPPNAVKRRARTFGAVELQRSRAGRGQRLPSDAGHAGRCLSPSANLGAFGSARAEAIPPERDAVNRTEGDAVKAEGPFEPSTWHERVIPPGSAIELSRRALGYAKGELGRRCAASAYHGRPGQPMVGVRRWP